jgi:hypothetical protein
MTKLEAKLAELKVVSDKCQPLPNSTAKIEQVYEAAAHWIGYAPKLIKVIETLVEQRDQAIGLLSAHDMKDSRISKEYNNEIESILEGINEPKIPSKTS